MVLQRISINILTCISLFIIITLVTERSFASEISVQGRFVCGRSIANGGLGLNCQNAYVQGLNLSTRPHLDSMVPINKDGFFNLVMPLEINASHLKNEMSFFVRSYDEDRTLGIFYLRDESIDGGLTESFWLDKSIDFGDLKISRKREIIIGSIK